MASVDGSGPELKLLGYAASTCSQKVRLCLNEKRLAFADTTINLAEGEHLSPEYLKLNPNGVVPTLLHNAHPVTDSSVIIEYLDEEFAAAPLTPRAGLSRAKMRAWMRFVEEVPTDAIRYPSFAKYLGKRLATLSEDELTIEIQARPLRGELYRLFGRTGVAPNQLDHSSEMLKLTLSRMQAMLAERVWLISDDLTLADICILPIIDRMVDLGLESLIDDKPDVWRWYLAWQKRESYRATFYAGSRLSDIAGYNLANADVLTKLNT